MEKTLVSLFNQWEVYHRQQTAKSAAVMIAIISVKLSRGRRRGQRLEGSNGSIVISHLSVRKRLHRAK